MHGGRVPRHEEYRLAVRGISLDAYKGLCYWHHTEVKRTGDSFRFGCCPALLRANKEFEIRSENRGLVALPLAIALLSLARISTRTALVQIE